VGILLVIWLVGWDVARFMEVVCGLNWMHEGVVLTCLGVDDCGG
jgi:hypothetical protein